MGKTSIEWTEYSGLRQCRKCRQFKSLSEFSKDRSRCFGRKYVCRACDWVPTPLGPTMRERADRLALGEKWCCDCAAWLPDNDVSRGRCRVHQNERYRHYYANGGKASIAARVHARKRGIEPIPAIGIEHLMETFRGLCAFGCGRKATTFDHLVPVSKGGRTEPGNMVPACLTCNSRKRAKDPIEWITSLEEPHPALMSIVELGAMNGVFDAAH